MKPHSECPITYVDGQPAQVIQECTVLEFPSNQAHSNVIQEKIEEITAKGWRLHTFQINQGCSRYIMVYTRDVIHWVGGGTVNYFGSKSNNELVED